MSKAETFTVWRRNDGYIGVTAYTPFPKGSFEILLQTGDWPEARQRVEDERKKAGHPANGRFWEEDVVLNG